MAGVSPHAPRARKVTFEVLAHDCYPARGNGCGCRCGVVVGVAVGSSGGSFFRTMGKKTLYLVPPGVEVRVLVAVDPPAVGVRVAVCVRVWVGATLGVWVRVRVAVKVRVGVDVATPVPGAAKLADIVADESLIPVMATPLSTPLYRLLLGLEAVLNVRFPAVPGYESPPSPRSVL